VAVPKTDAVAQNLQSDRATLLPIDRTASAYDFLRSRRGGSFDVSEMAEATGWKPATIRTYVAKKWSGFVRPADQGRLRVEAFELSRDEFTALQSQVTKGGHILEPTYDYDVALSFSGDDREYVESVAAALNHLGVRVFYDRYEAVDLWGKNLYEHLDDVYRKRARFCVIFVSASYAEKLWTTHERQAAQARALTAAQEYILPVRFDGTVLPGLLPTIAYVEARDHSPDDLALMVARKTGLDVDLRGMLEYLRQSLPDYEIELEGTSIRFRCETEQYDGAFPSRILIEMYREGMLDFMFLYPAIVPI